MVGTVSSDAGSLEAYVRRTDDLTRLARNASTGKHFEDLRWNWHRGVFSHVDKLACRPLSLIDLSPLTWLRVTRLEAPEPDVRPAIVEALSAFGKSRVPVVVLVSDGPEGGLHLGIRQEGAERGAWLRSVLAPGTLIEEVRSDPAVLRTFSHMSNGLVFGTVAGGEKDTGRTGAPGLARLLLSPPGGWAVLLRLDPVPFVTAREIDRSLIDLAMALARLGTVSDSSNAEKAVTIERPEAQLLLEAVKGRIAHVSAAESVGLWNAKLYVAARDENQLEVVTAAAGSILQQERLAGNRWVVQRSVARSASDADAAAFPSPSTLLSTDDLAHFLLPGSASLPGVEVAVAPPAGRQQCATERALRLGTWSGTDARTVLDVQDLEGHAFVTGTTGTGKSTTVQNLLLDLWNEHQVRFLVIDPVKADYNRLASCLKGGLEVLDAAELALNVLEPFPGFPPRTHLELVANAFKGSFSLPAPVPYVVSQLFEQLVERSTVDPAPTLHDLRDLLDPYVASLGYRGEVEANIRASLGLRLAHLLAPSKAERVAAVGGPSLRTLFDRPTVVELSSLGDDEERAFLMSVLTLYVSERARVAGSSNGEVRHVTVLEEAHRILPEPRTGGGSEEGDAASVSAKLLTQMLAEIRSYGEAVIVVDQSPSAVARDVVRNTNLKISHRLPDPEDREVVGGSLGLAEDAFPSLARLRKGEVLVSTRRSAEAQTVLVDAPPPEPTTVAPFRSPRRRPVAEEDTRPCCRGAGSATHHAAEALSREAQAAMSLVLHALGSGAEDWPSIWRETDEDLHVVVSGAALLSADPGQAGRCLAWIGLRRGVLRHVDHGGLLAADAEQRLSHAFRLWEGRRSQRKVRITPDPAPDHGPLYGCRWCDAVCRFRHLAEVSPNYGEETLMVGLRSLWSPPGFSAWRSMAHWSRQTQQRLTPLLGPEEAHRAARCAGAHLAARLEMPRNEQDDLLTRKIDD